jgi:membrane associated rhomboid family serine protease
MALQQPRSREPMFNTPWPAVVLAGSIVLSYALQIALFAPNAAETRFGATTEGLFRGEWATLITMMWVHGNWSHALSNAAFALVCGAPVARLLGLSLPRALAYFLFYLVCGVIANGLCAVTMQAMEPDKNLELIGASGACSGLVGAAVRTIERRGRLGPILTRTTVGIGCFWTVSNIVVGLGFDPTSTGGLTIAWPAHVIGFFAGLVLIGPWTRLFGARSDMAALDFPGLVDR